MKRLMILLVGLLTMLVPLSMVSAVDQVSCENDYGRATVRQNGYSVECENGGAHDSGGSGTMIVSEAECLRILERECGGGELSCEASGTYSACPTPKGACFFYHGDTQYECFCHDGSGSACAAASADLRCTDAVDDTCPEVAVDTRCLADKGACWLYPAGFWCQCKNRENANLGNLGDPGNAANYLSDKSCNDLVETFCAYEGETVCPARYVDTCLELSRAQLDCAQPVMMRDYFDFDSCCQLMQAADATETDASAYIACIEREACDLPQQKCETLHPNYDPDRPDGDTPSDGDRPDGDTTDGDSPSDGDEADGDTVSDEGQSSDNGDASVEDGDLPSDGDMADGDAGLGTDDGGCSQTGGVFWMLALLMLGVFVRRLRKTD